MADRSLGTILVVDDVEMNRELLARRLKRAGYNALTAEDGAGCLRMVEAGGLDTVILDVMMPDLSGTDILRRLRATRSMSDLPIIMATARTESEEVVEALGLGANDYVTKPIDFPVLLARVKTHLAIKQLSRQKDEFLQIASHDLKNPLTVILSAVRMIEQFVPPGTLMPEDFHRMAGGAARQAFAMKRIIEDYLDFQAAEEGQLRLLREDVDLCVVAAHAVEDLRPYADTKQIALRIECAGEVRASADPVRLRQVLDNLIGNAVKFSPADTTVAVRVKGGNGTAIVEVSDQGPAFGPDDLPRLFTRYGRTANAPTGGEKSSGLGLAICRHIVELHGGEIAARNNDGAAGATFAIRLGG